MKKCTKCWKTKKESEYYKNPRTLDGLRCECKACTKADNSAYRRRIAKIYSDDRLLILREVVNLTENLCLKITELDQYLKKQGFG